MSTLRNPFKQGEKLLVLSGLLVVFGATAVAGPVPLGALTPGFYDQQDSPCVIGKSCGTNLGLPVNDSNQLSAGTILSPVYNGADLASLIGMVGTSPLLAIDINQSGSSLIDIQYIKVWMTYGSDPTPVEAFRFSGQTGIVQLNTGSGNSDYVISGLDFSDPSISSLWFAVSYSGNTDGAETYFLVGNGSAQVPEPGTLLLLGAGLIGLALFARMR